MIGRIMKYAIAGVVALGLSVAAQAQTASGEGQTQERKVFVTSGPAMSQDNGMGIFRRDVYVGRSGSFAFEGIVGGFGGRVVTGAPFSAQVTHTTHQVLADGTQINRTETGSMARDSAGRTRHEMTFENIGPLTASGQAPHIVFIRDPAAGKSYILNEDKQTVSTINRRMRAGTNDEGRREQRMNRASGRENPNVQATSLGTKTIDGLTVEGTRVTRTIPAGRIGNDKPIVITREEWYSPDLQMVVSSTRTDPRFGTTTYQMTNISRSEPSETLFTVPAGYTESSRFHGARPQGRSRQQ